MDEVLTWAAVKAWVKEQPKGAQRRLAEALELDPSDLNRRLKTSRDLSERHARAARALMEGAPLPQTEVRAVSAPSNRLPVYGYAAGDDGELILLNDGDIIEWFELPHGIVLGPGEYFIARHVGSSMLKRYFPGDNHVVRRNYPPGYNKAALIELKSGHGAVKLYRGQRDGQVFGEQLNPEKLVHWPATEVKAIHAIAFTL